MEIIDRAEAVRSLGFTNFSGPDEVDGFTYHNEGDISPTEEAIQAEIVKLQAEYNAQAYSRARKAKYDALNQLELISDDAINDTTTHKDAIVAIKTAHPKPE